MIQPQEITGIVLAGGKSSRFGSNKALAIWKEETLLQHTLKLLKPFCKEVWIGGENREYAILPNRKLPDMVAGLGPLGGIYTAMENTDTPYLLFLTCDMPLIQPSLLKYLLSDEPCPEITLWKKMDGTLEIFPLLLSHRLGTWIKWKVHHNSLSIRSLLLEATTRFIPVSYEDENYFLNVNRKEDLEKLLKYE